MDIIRRSAYSFKTRCFDILPQTVAEAIRSRPTSTRRANRFGESAAIDFVSIYASEALTRAIETVMDNENRKNPPTLATVRDARWPAASPPAWSETASWKTMRPNC